MCRCSAVLPPGAAPGAKEHVASSETCQVLSDESFLQAMDSMMELPIPTAPVPIAAPATVRPVDAKVDEVRSEEVPRISVADLKRDKDGIVTVDRGMTVAQIDALLEEGSSSLTQRDIRRLRRISNNRKSASVFRKRQLSKFGQVEAEAERLRAENMRLQAELASALFEAQTLRARLEQAEMHQGNQAVSSLVSSSPDALETSSCPSSDFNLDAGSPSSADLAYASLPLSYALNDLNWGGTPAQL